MKAAAPTRPQPGPLSHKYPKLVFESNDDLIEYCSTEDVVSSLNMILPRDKDILNKSFPLS